MAKKKVEKKGVFKGEYVAVGNAEEVAKAVKKADAVQRVYMTAPKETTERVASRIVRKQSLRITPKRPRLR